MNKSYQVAHVYIGAENPDNWKVSDADIKAIADADKAEADYKKIKRGDFTHVR